MKRREYRSNRNAVYASHDHVVFTPKYGRSVLEEPGGSRLKQLVRDVSWDPRVEVVRQEVIADHVYLLVNVDPQSGVHRYVKRLKGTTSRTFRQEYPWLRSRLPTLRTNAYFVATTGGVTLDVVKRYVENLKGR